MITIADGKFDVAFGVVYRAVVFDTSNTSGMIVAVRSTIVA